MKVSMQNLVFVMKVRLRTQSLDPNEKGPSVMKHYINIQILVVRTSLQGAFTTPPHPQFLSTGHYLLSLVVNVEAKLPRLSTPQIAHDSCSYNPPCVMIWRQSNRWFVFLQLSLEVRSEIVRRALKFSRSQSGKKMNSDVG